MTAREQLKALRCLLGIHRWSHFSDVIPFEDEHGIACWRVDAKCLQCSIRRTLWKGTRD